jgi:hypothetical protein
MQIPSVEPSVVSVTPSGLNAVDEYVTKDPSLFRKALAFVGFWLGIPSLGGLAVWLLAYAQYGANLRP